MELSRLEWPSTKNRRWIGRMVLTLLVVVCLGVGIDFLRFVATCGGYAKLSERQTLADGPREEEAIVVLTGDHSRIPRAVDLMRVRGSRWLIISGAGKGISLTDLINQQGVSAGNIHEIWEKIIVESNSSSTAENAIESTKILHEKKMTRAMLVTSDYHMERSLAAFRLVDRRTQYFPYPVRSDFFDSNLAESPQRALKGVVKVIVEYFKFVSFLLTTNQK